MRRIRLFGLLFVGLAFSACGGTTVAGECVPTPFIWGDCYPDYPDITLPPDATTTTTTVAPTSTTMAADYAIAAEPPSREVKHGGSATYLVEINGNSAFEDVVTLGVSGLPPNASATFDPATLRSGESSTLTVKTSRGASNAGTYTLTISGTTSREMSRSTTVTLTITK